MPELGQHWSQIIDSEAPRRPVCWLGVYGAVVAFFMLALDVTALLNEPGLLSVLSVHPRFGIGLFLAETTVGPTVLTVLDVLSLSVACLVMSRRNSWSLFVYLVCEAFLALPTLLIIGLGVLSNMSSGHGLPIGVVIPAAISTVCTAAPWFFAKSLYAQILSQTGYGYPCTAAGT